MDILDTKKPAWSKEPQPLNFNLVNSPLEAIYNSIVAGLTKDNREPKGFYFILRCLLTISFQTYNAIRKLVATDPKYPAQAHILNRSLIDTLFTIVAMTENLQENAKKYEKAGYRLDWASYEREKKRYGNNPEWNNLLKKKEELLKARATLLNLSDEEKNNPIKTIEYWPNPYQLLGKSKSSNPIISLSDDKQKLLNEVKEWRYGELSEWSHVGWGGMAMGMYATKPKNHWHPGKFESDAVYTAILFILMILSEIELSCNYGEIKNLRYTWVILAGFYDEAKDYYNLRYNSLLVEAL